MGLLPARMMPLRSSSVLDAAGTENTWSTHPEGHGPTRKSIYTAGEREAAGGTLGKAAA